MLAIRLLALLLVLILVCSNDGSAQFSFAATSTEFRSPDGQALDGPGYLRLRVANAANTYSDEALIVYTSGSPATDSEDVPKFSFSHPVAPRIATMGDGSVLLAINAYGPFTEAITIPVMLKVATNGSYTITTTGLSGLGYSCFTMEDLLTGAFTVLADSAAFSFNALASADPNIPRFLLHATAPLELALLSPACAGDSNGEAHLSLPDGPADVLWTDANGLEVLSGTQLPAGTVAMDGLQAGTYNIQVLGITVCGVLNMEFEMFAPDPLESDPESFSTSCSGRADGRIELYASGGTMPYTYLWSNGDTTATLTAPAGTYAAMVVDANGCEMGTDPIVVEEGPGPEAIAEVDATEVLVGEEVAFTSGSDPELDHNWDFGDGSTSTELDPEHAYTVPGTYIVTLTVSDGPCASSRSITVVVQSTTGISAERATTMNVWFRDDRILVDLGTVQSEVGNSARAGQQRQAAPRAELPERQRLAGRSGGRSARGPVVRAGVGWTTA
ncbi:MAG: PKD domain-containing protein [Flavobacteriales bacterium]